jgi:SAM-dependent methyltransferase
MIKRLMDTAYEKNRFLRLLALKMGIAPSVIAISNKMSSSRFIEYPWILLNLEKECHRILDVGSVGSVLPILMACQGYEVYCIDVRPYEHAEILSSLKSVVGDIRQTNFQTDFFDCVIAVSTVEHLGLGRYGDPTDDNGDIKAVLEIERILRKDGRFLLTVPYGKHSITPSHRVYDKNALTNLLTGFCITAIQCFSRKEKAWLPCSADELSDVDSSIIENGIICIKLKKV